MLNFGYTKPGAFDGEQIVDYFDDGQALFEAQQSLDENGTWVLDGRWTAWHENGQLHESGAYSMRKEVGLWEWWGTDGSQVARGSFDQGKREGPWTYWYPDGIKMVDANYREGKGEGLWTLFHENGMRKAQGEFLNGEISGYWTIWKENGEVNEERTGRYEGGERVSD